MKQLITLFFISTFIVGMAQERIPIPKHLQDISIRTPLNQPAAQEYSGKYLPLKQKTLLSAVEEEIGDTRYDNQSNASIPKKIYYYDDGTIAATWTRSMEEGTFFADRGTGYNYFDGQQWHDWPTGRVEDIKVHRPVYAPLGDNGELLISHTSGSGLYMARNEEKGTGDWDFETISGPPDEDYLVWARVVTSGVDRNRVHLLALTLPESHNGQAYQGLSGALLYSMSEDGGDSWVIEHEILDGMTSDDYSGFAGDTYAFAEPVGNVIAFVVGDPWKGLFLMKSTDGGYTFEKTVIWEHPYPDWEPGMAADTFYCADGSHSVALDESGMAHVVFGISRVEADAQNTYWYPWIDGIAYWNETLPAFSDGLHTLDPYDHPDSELEKDVTLIGWTQDVNSNGELEFAEDMGIYSIGMSSMPQLVIDGEFISLIYSSVTETFDNGIKNYRHIWSREGWLKSDLPWWSQTFTFLTSDLVHIFDECVYPAVAPHTGPNNTVHMIYQADQEPGIATWYQQHNYVDNRITYLHTEFIPVGGTENTGASIQLSVGQNVPNPFNDQTVVKVENQVSSNLTLHVFNPAGVMVYEEIRTSASPGIHMFKVDGSQFASGIYFYSVSDGTNTATRKMVVE
jgi:hypothetical protein